MKTFSNFSEYIIFADESGDHGMLSINPDIPFYVITTAIDKRAHSSAKANSGNPYSLALEFCIKNSYSFLQKEKQLSGLTHIIVESRGKVEDDDLKLAFKKISEQEQISKPYPFDIKFACKKTNSCGLQIADLVAHPIAKHVIKPNSNKAFEVIEKKLFGYPIYEEVGLKRYPLETKCPS